MDVPNSQCPISRWPVRGYNTSSVNAVFDNTIDSQSYDRAARINGRSAASGPRCRCHHLYLRPSL